MHPQRVLGAFVTSTLAAALASTISTPAFAQAPGADLRGAHVSTDPASGIYLEPADSPNTGEWNVGLVTSYAFQPVTLVSDRDGTKYHVVSNQLTGDLVGGVGLFHRVFVGLDLPFLIYQTGDALTPGVKAAAGDFTVPRQALGDLGIDVKTTLLRPTAGDLGGFAIALHERLTLPTGDDQSFLGEGSPTSETRVLAEFRAVTVAVHAALGVKLRGDVQPFGCAVVTPQHPEACPTRFGHEIPFGLGLSVKPQMFGVDKAGRFNLYLETYGHLPLAPTHPFTSVATSEAQLALGARAAFGPVSVLAGVEHALIAGVGNPNFRATLGVGWAPRIHDADGDGIPDEIDQCPNLAEDKDGFQDADGCPDGDNDDDGVPDVDDACPNVAGVETSDPKTNGCPATPKPTVGDRDGDGIPDDKDKCPDQPEDKDGFEDADGCPDPDNDKDGIPDKEDACPDVAGPKHPDPKLNGCPDPDKDHDTFVGAEDKCPDAAEDFNGFEDADGCPDADKPQAKRLKPLVAVKTKKAVVWLELSKRITFTPAGELDAASSNLVRAVAAEVAKKPNWALLVGVRPKPNEAPEAAMKRAAGVAAKINGWTRRPGGAKAAPWKDVKATPRAEEFGVGFVVEDQRKQ